MERKWLIMAVAVAGSFMSVLDSTIVNIAIPTLQDDFDAEVSSVQWVITVYLLALGVSIPTVGFLADRLGLRKVFTSSLILFTAGSLLCGLAPNLPVLIVFRIIQGLGGGGLMPLSMAMVFNAFEPHERGKAMGLMGVPVLMGPALGPTLGGWIVQDFDWRLIFLINLPFGALGVVMALRWLEPFAGSAARKRLDMPGIVLSAAGAALFLFGVSEAPEAGWGSAQVVGALLAGVATIAVFVWVELRTEDPVLDIRLFANGSFLSANVANWLAGAALFAGMLLLPLFLQNLAGKSPLHAGLLLMPQALGAAAFMPIGGRLYDRFGVKVPSGIGLVLATVGTFLLVTLEADSSSLHIAGILVVRGIGMGMAMMPLNTACLAAAGSTVGARASSLVTVTRQISASLGVAAVATFLQSRSEHYAGPGVDAVTAGTQAFHDTFLLTGAMVAPAIIATLLIVIRKPERAPAPAPAPAEA